MGLGGVGRGNVVAGVVAPIKAPPRFGHPFAAWRGSARHSLPSPPVLAEPKEIQSGGSYRGKLTAPFGVSFPAKYPPGIPWSFTTDIFSPSHPATPPPTVFLRLRPK